MRRQRCYLGPIPLVRHSRVNLESDLLVWELGRLADIRHLISHFMWKSTNPELIYETLVYLFTGLLLGITSQITSKHITISQRSHK